MSMPKQQESYFGFMSEFLKFYDPSKEIVQTAENPWLNYLRSGQRFNLKKSNQIYRRRLEVRRLQSIEHLHGLIANVFKIDTIFIMILISCDVYHDTESVDTVTHTYTQKIAIPTQTTSGNVYAFFVSATLLYRCVLVFQLCMFEQQYRPIRYQCKYHMIPIS